MSVSAIDLKYVPAEDANFWKGRQSNAREKYAALLEMYSRVSPRKESEIPNVPGLCIPLGFIKGKAGGDEEVYQGQILKEMPDVRIHFIGDSSIREEDTLLDRIPMEVEIRTKMSSNFKLLRSGHRQTKYGFEFDEMLTRGPTNESVVPFGNERMIGNQFTLEANSKTGKAEAPFFRAYLFNGNRQSDPRDSMDKADHPWPHLAKPSLSEAEAIELWDVITSTLRPRPNGF